MLPAPTPLPYAVVGTEPGAVNRAKGRPADQPIGVDLRDLDVAADQLELSPAARALARWLLESERESLMATVRADAPAWVLPACADGVFFFASCWLDKLRSLVRERDFLYMSSANPTGSAVAVTAAQADSAFGGRLLVLDGDEQRDPAREHGSTTILEMAPDGTLRLRRYGINDARHLDDTKAFLRDLHARWRAPRAR